MTYTAVLVGVANVAKPPSCMEKLPKHFNISFLDMELCWFKI